MLIQIIKTNDLRYYHLYNLVRVEEDCEYCNTYIKNRKITKLVLPLEGIDSFGIIKNTTLNLETIILNNNLEIIYTGKVNDKLLKLVKLYNIKLYSFFDDLSYVLKEKKLRKEVIKAFLEDKLSLNFNEIKIVVLKNDLNLLELGKRDYDVIVNFSNLNLCEHNDKIIIEMRDIKDIDLSILLNCKNIYLINQLLRQYLTKSGGKILYDSMVKR